MLYLKWNYKIIFMKRSTVRTLVGVETTHGIIKSGRGLTKYSVMVRVNHKKRIMKVARLNNLSIDKALELYTSR